MASICREKTLYALFLKWGALLEAVFGPFRKLRIGNWEVLLACLSVAGPFTAKTNWKPTGLRDGVAMKAGLLG